MAEIKSISRWRGYKNHIEWIHPPLNFVPLLSRDYDGLHEYVTEKVYPEMKCNVEKKSIFWQFVKSLEPPRAVSVRVQDIIAKDNHFAQIIVRMHTQQVS